MKKSQIFFLVIFAIFVGTYFLSHDKKAERMVDQTSKQVSVTTNFVDQKYGVLFEYPKKWGEVVLLPENKECPEEDTYRTIDTLNIFDREYKFEEIKLPGSESMIRLGIKLYNLDPKNLNTCGDEFFIRLAERKMTGAEISSGILQPFDFPDFFGVYNDSASRLNTEGRVQYTMFAKREGEKYLIIQPYLSFIPYFGSPELAELDGPFGGDMQAYLKKGKTAEPVRGTVADLKIFAESILLSQD